LSERKELLIGCGSRREKMIYPFERREWSNLVTLDVDSSHKPDVVWNLNHRPLPFDDDTFDEIHAVEVLEHIGRQGDAVGFFAEFSEYWRIMKGDGLLCASVPMWNTIWAWSDPSHTRIISNGNLVFLRQPEYERGIGHNPMSDYRNIYRADFDLVFQKEEDEQYKFALRAVKPSRWRR